MPQTQHLSESQRRSWFSTGVPSASKSTTTTSASSLTRKWTGGNCKVLQQTMSQLSVRHINSVSPNVLGKSSFRLTSRLGCSGDAIPDDTRLRTLFASSLNSSCTIPSVLKDTKMYRSLREAVVLVQPTSDSSPPFSLPLRTHTCS